MGRVGAVLAVAFVLVAVWAGADALQVHKERKRTERAAEARRSRDLPDGSDRTRPATLAAVGPRLLSNRTSYPLMVWGWDLRPGLRLKLGEQLLPTTFVDDRHLTTRLPAGLTVPKAGPASTLRATLVDPAGGAVAVAGKAFITVINDTDYPVPTSLSLSPDGQQVMVSSAPTDSLWIARADGEGEVRQVAVGDGPVALASYELSGEPWLAVLHADAPEVWLMRLPALDGPARRIALRQGRWSGIGAAALHVDVEHDRLWVSVPAHDAVARFVLSTGEAVGMSVVGKRPGPLSGIADGVIVGEGPMGGLTAMTADGERSTRIEVRKGVSIASGATAGFSDYVMSGTSIRDVVYSPRLAVAFASSIGPNIGPNPKRMEVSMSGGIAVVDPDSGRYLRHVALPHGVPQGLALDEARGLLYAADVATGRVYALDAGALLDAEHAATALRATLELPPPSRAMLLRRAADFGAAAPSPISLHTGPWSLSLSADGSTLHVLERFTGRVTRVDVSAAAGGTMTVLGGRTMLDMTQLRQRRIGEIVFFTDLGDSRMSCDACHRDGHGEGVLYTKGDRLHIYRVPTLRNIRETPPYFTPVLAGSLPKISSEVLGRNRFHRPEPSKLEVGALAMYQASLTAPPNPLRGPQGQLPTALVLPDGKTGNAAKGLQVFERRGRCMKCHAGPVFSNDQRSATRGRLYDVGTPVMLALRPQMQDTQTYELPPPSLSAIRDNFPLLHSGAGGLDVADDQLRVAHSFALRRVIELGRQTEKHGNMHGLTVQQEDDLLAYLLSL